MGDFYQKIFPPFVRDTTGPNRKALDRNRWFNRELELLADVPGWTFTEKIDGTNIAVIYNGHAADVRTREGNPLETMADLDPQTIDSLRELFHVTVMEQAFGTKPARLFLEVHGKGIGDHPYLSRKLPNQRAVMIDANINGFWLARDTLEGLATETFGLPCAPHLPEIATLTEAVKAVSVGLPSTLGPFTAEGLVGVAPLGLFNRKGERILVKVKTEDLCFDGGAA